MRVRILSATGVSGKRRRKFFSSSITLFSSLKRQGVGEVAQILHDWVTPAVPTGLPDTQPTEPAA